MRLTQNGGHGAAYFVHNSDGGHGPPYDTEQVGRLDFIFAIFGCVAWILNSVNGYKN
jgi:hypothetical protein